MHKTVFIPRQPAVTRLALLVFWGLPLPAPAQNPVATVLADFEDDSVAASIGGTSGVLRADCVVQRSGLPARGQNSLAVTIGATQAEVSALVDLVFRTPERFTAIDEIGAFVWIKDASVKLAFRLRDASGRLFETPEQSVSEANRWVSAAVAFDEKKLKPVAGEDKPVWPLQLAGFRVTTTARGRQTIHLDDLQVQYSAPTTKMLAGTFRFDEPTRIYSPGAKVQAQAVLENQSREKALTVTVELAWTNLREEVIRKQSATVNLPVASKGFRSLQSIDFSETINTPGVYRLVARARAAGWTAPTLFETTIAVTPTNRYLSRGRSKLFGIHTNLLRETATDQLLELAIARDVGAEIVLLDVAWPRLEPKDDTFDSAFLAPLLDLLSQSSVAAALAISDVPEWLPPDAAEHEKQLAVLVAHLAEKFSGKLRLIQLPAALFQDRPAADGVKAAQRLQTQVAGGRIAIVAPPIPVAKVAELPADVLAGVGWAVATEGTTSDALTALGQWKAPAWSDEAWWEHAAAAVRGAGAPDDAFDVLRHYIAAAAAQVGGVFWFDLRDDDTAGGPANELRGLIRRDFSPKLALLGYASAAGTLAGLTYSGPVLGAPAEFESALFIGSDRQLAILIPKPNRILPAVVGLRAGVAGDWEVRRFDRSAQGMIATAPMPLYAPAREPSYITLKLGTVQPNPQIGCQPPWLRAAGTAFIGEEFLLEVEPTEPIRKGFWQANVPANAPYRIAPANGAIAGAPGKAIRIPIQVGAKAGQNFDRAELSLRIAINDRSFEIPIEVRPSASLKPLGGAAAPTTDASHALSELVSSSRQRPSASVKLFGGYRKDALQLVIEVEDDRATPAAGESENGASGDRLRLGLAVAGMDEHREIEIRDTQEQVTLIALDGRPAPQWKVSRSEQSGRRVFQIAIPAASLGLQGFDAGQRLLLACTYTDDDADGYGPATLAWGEGLDGRRSSAGFRWVRLAKE